jgi:hypothetical protein
MRDSIPQHPNAASRPTAAAVRVHLRRHTTRARGSVTVSQDMGWWHLRCAASAPSIGAAAACGALAVLLESGCRQARAGAAARALLADALAQRGEAERQRRGAAAEQ